MKTSYNILVIESLSIDTEESNNMVSLKSEMKAEIKFKCPATGNHFRTTIITAESRGYSQENAIKNVIQEFFNGRVHTRNRFYNRSIQCITDNQNIHHIDIQMPEPYKSLFENLFDSANWQIPKHISNASTPTNI